MALDCTVTLTNALTTSEPYATWRPARLSCSVVPPHTPHDKNFRQSATLMYHSLMSEKVAIRDADVAPLAPLFRVAWQHSRRRIYEQLRQAGYEDLGLGDLTVFQYPTPEGARPTDLAEGALMTKQAINRTIRHLEECGYLRLEPTASDQRERVVRLTARGRRLMANIRRLHAGIEAEWAERIGPRQLAALRRTMPDLIDGICG